MKKSPTSKAKVMLTKLETRTVKLGTHVLEVTGSGAATYWREPAFTSGPFGARFLLASPEFRRDIEEAEKSRRKNPVPKLQGGERMALIREAAKLYNNFTGHNEMEIHRVKIPNLPKAVAVFGELDCVEYTCVRDGKTELYRHEFSWKSKPLLCASADGKQLFIIGGRYKFTERGIVDKG